MAKSIFIAGGGGFIGSHFVDHFLAAAGTECVTIYDNFSSGKLWHNRQHQPNSRLRTIYGDIKEADKLTNAMLGHDLVIHLASNPDIARAVSEPSIDFTEGTLLTHNIVEAMRVSGVKRIIYASGSGIYGELGEKEINEDHGPLLPISTYGASKLAGEALICAYCHMFDLTGLAFRFGNVVGPRQTHGVGYDFIKKLKNNPHKLEILGDGSQSKSYIHISDVINAVLLANERTTKCFDAFNVATGDYITVKEIAEIVVAKVCGADNKVVIIYTGGDRGWKGDVPVMRLNCDKIKALGWRCRLKARQAIEASIDEMIQAKMDQVEEQCAKK